MYVTNCNIRNIADKRENRVALAWLVWMIVSSGGVSLWRGNGTITILVNLLWTFYFLLRENRLKINRRNAVLLVSTIIVLLLHFVVLLAGEYTWSGTLHVISVVLMAYFAVEKFRAYSMARCYCDVVEVIAVISLVTYVFQPVILEYRHLLPYSVSVNSVSKAVTHYTNIYVALLRWEGVQRNQAIFWEPGAYQVFLNIALMFELFILKRDSKATTRLIILIAAIATTLSTAGIFNLCILFGAYVFSQGVSQRNRTLLLIVIVLGVGWSLLSEQIIGSIETKFGVETGVASDSVTSRVQPFLMDLEMLTKYPFGVGIDRYAIELNKMKAESGIDFVSSSCTQTVLGASFGWLALLVIFLGSVGLGKRMNYSVISSSLIFIFLLLLFSTESFVYYPLFYYLIFSGICTEKEEWRC